MAPIFCDRCGNTVAEECDPLDELAQLDALLERLTLKHYDLKRKINRFHSPIVRQLPPDVTSTIFEFCLPDFEDLQSSPSRVDSSVPLILGAICSYWREIAWSTPSLWSSLTVHVSGNDSHTTIVKQWLARSGQLPLSISIYSASNRHQVSALADIINQYSTRWSQLYLRMPQCFHQFFHAIDNHAPILKSIRFDCLYSGSGEKFQLTCPRLERADLSWFRVNGTNILWDNLTHLNLSSISCKDSFLILHRTPRLVFCIISWVAFRADLIIPVMLPSLRSLHLVATDIKEWFNNLVTPRLEELSLLGHPALIMENLNHFKGFTLRYFSVIFSVPAFIYLECFINPLQLMPFLRTVSITSLDAQNILQLVAKVLTSQNTILQEPFLPDLEVLEYSGPVQYPENPYPLPSSDNAVHGPLRLLKLNLEPKFTRIPKNFIPYFLSLAERGVTVNVLSGSEDILQSSMDYYRGREESLSPDWADNLDLGLMQGLC